MGSGHTSGALMREREIGVKSDMDRRREHAAIQSPKQARNRRRPAGSLSRSTRKPPFILVLKPSIGHRGSRRSCSSAGDASGRRTWRARLWGRARHEAPFWGCRSGTWASSKAGRSRHLSASFAEACFRVRATAVVLQGAGLPFARNADVCAHLFGERRDIHIADAVVERRNIL